MKKSIIWLVAIVVIIILIGAYFFTRPTTSTDLLVDDLTASTTPVTDESVNQAVDKTKTVIGQSVEKRDITAYHYGTGATEILFIGGIHGGYEWNTSLVAYQLMDYLTANPSAIPQNLKVTVIPVLNPDGLNKVVGTAGRFTVADVSTNQNTVVAGRLNADQVDLNRNFDCDWQASAVWQKTKVSGGSKAFSEPESLAFKNYVEANKPVAAIVWYSAAGGVFASQCDNGILAGTRALMNTFATASGYTASDSFDFYETTGDMVNWLAKKNIPAISVILSTHNDTEWSKNLAGTQAVLKSYAK
ncbi:MAG: M14 family metallopeptidase [Candidatus Paceibacterota bacterium]|jgi:hypothetical protein